MKILNILVIVFSLFILAACKESNTVTSTNPSDSNNSGADITEEITEEGPTHNYAGKWKLTNIRHKYKYSNTFTTPDSSGTSYKDCNDVEFDVTIEINEENGQYSLIFPETQLDCEATVITLNSATRNGSLDNIESDVEQVRFYKFKQNFLSSDNLRFEYLITEIIITENLQFTYTYDDKLYDSHKIPQAKRLRTTTVSGTLEFLGD